MASKWALQSEERVFKGGHLNVLRRSFRVGDGSVRDYEVLDQGMVVCVLALTEARECVLVRQFRPGPQRTLTELPAGFIDKGETPADAAARELSEETGYTGELRQVAQLPANGYSTEIRHVFVGTDCAPGTPHPDKGEDLEVVTVSLARLRELLRTGDMTVTDAAYVALDSLGLL